ncbi:MAG: ribose 5-phosphate isomerase B [Candidatus Scalindua rubra]|uniref:Ribose 5-phosphate isomerase B n=1 Tax=Candidatus Scalindua rubra TaxID=1872076 RepID=A0A1E3XB79_9BACT|nr:MAG: ribose 5-phosphate isomerase B [Candidatus Scalindua rubra]
MKIALASDHRGFEFKNIIANFLSNMGHETVDFGTKKGDNSVDYPDYGLQAAKAVGSGECERAILVCGTGIGMSLVANKVKGVRATVCHDLYTVEMSRRHNDSNVLCLGADTVDHNLLEKKIKLFVETLFEGGRHARRVGKIMDAESG